MTGSADRSEVRLNWAGYGIIVGVLSVSPTWSRCPRGSLLRKTILYEVVAAGMQHVDKKRRLAMGEESFGSGR